ncbi:hypothetical protein [Nocardia arthritidis]|uniref:hypothetical protein n=1 Tax=Nocardia arthritidis TaxID=228602 RepID=UPI0007A515AE|nr:hypothetical protein [Nocardia arthritidis]
MSSESEKIMMGRDTPVAPADGRHYAEYAARWMSLLILALMTVSSVAGLWIERLYRDPPEVAAALRGYDFIALVIGAPLLAAALVPRWFHAAWARSIWIGVLAYAVYNYALYVFGTSFNGAFLIHTALFSLSIGTFVLALASTDVDAVAARFSAATPVRSVAMVLLILAGSLGAMWIYYSIRFAVTDEVTEPSRLILPSAMTHLGFVLDLALLVPSYAAAAVLLWRRRPWGFILATALLLAGSLHQFAYISAMIFQVRAAIPGAGFDSAEPFITGAFVGATALLLYRCARGPVRHPARGTAGDR